MEKHIEVNCFEFEEYTLEHRKKAIELQMLQYIKMLSLVIKYLKEDTFKIDFIIREDIGQELEIDIKVDKENIEELFINNYKELIKGFDMNTTKITFNIKKALV